MAVVG